MYEERTSHPLLTAHQMQIERAIGENKDINVTQSLQALLQELADSRMLQSKQWIPKVPVERVLASKKRIKFIKLLKMLKKNLPL